MPVGSGWYNRVEHVYLQRTLEKAMEVSEGAFSTSFTVPYRRGLVYIEFRSKPAGMSTKTCPSTSSPEASVVVEFLSNGRNLDLEPDQNSDGVGRLAPMPIRVSGTAEHGA